LANSVHQDRQGPVWPLGSILVPTPGTPVNIMSLVDPTSINAPETPTPGTAGANEYTNRAQQVIFQAFKSGGATRLAANAGNIYIIKKPLAGAGGTGDVGTVLWVLTPGQTWSLGSAALNRNVFNLYEYFIDADSVNDGAQVTAIIQ
jgi:hypothetical protein